MKHPTLYKSSPQKLNSEGFVLFHAIFSYSSCRSV